MSFNSDHEQHDHGLPTHALAQQGGDESGGSASSGDQFSTDDSNQLEGSQFILTEETKPRISRTTIVMFGVLAIGATAVWFMYQRIGGPSKAAASTESVQAKKTINAFLDGGGANIRTMESLIKNTERVVQQFLSYPSMTQVPLSDLRMNPFRLRAPTPANAPVDDAVEKRKREEERVAMLKAVQSLQLQSVMCSDARKACMINGAMYREGQQIDAFTIEKITQTSVIVHGGVYRFELKMQR